MRLADILKGHKAYWADGAGRIAVRNGRMCIFDWYAIPAWRLVAWRTPPEPGDGYELCGNSCRVGKGATKHAVKA